MASISEQTTDPTRARYKVRWREADGSARSVSFTSLAAAKRKLREVEGGKDDGTHIDDRKGRITVEEWSKIAAVEGWVDLAASTRDVYGTLLRVHIVPSKLGDRPLRDVSRDDVQDFVGALSRTLSAAASVRKVYYVLSRLFDDAIAAGRIRGPSPCSGIRLPKIENKVPETVLATELAKLALTLPDDYSAIAFVMGTAGLRVGEALALQWRDVDLDSDRPTITVRGGVVVAGGDPRVSTPKTRAGIRSIPIESVCADSLRELRDRKDPGARDLVFPGPGGGLFRPGNFRRRIFAPAVAAVGLSITPHALRHTALTTWLEEGAAPMLAAAWAGHADGGALIVRTYGHVRPAHADQIVDALDRRRRIV